MRLRTALALLALLAGSSPAWAQNPHGMSLPMLGARPLHERVTLADAVAIGTIGEVETGRITVRDAVAVLGNAPESFALKRAPSQPPGLSPGERTLLLLRGARSPYLLVDRASEIARIRDDADAARWTRALRDVRAAATPADLLALYAGWLDGGPEPLLRAALRGLADSKAGFGPLPAEVSVHIARAAADPALDPDLRLLATFVALRHESAHELLLAELPGDGEGADPTVVAAGLRGGILRRSAELEPAVLRSLRHPRPDVRRAALGAASDVRSQAVGEALAEIARDDPDAGLRREAGKSLERWARSR